MKYILLALLNFLSLSNSMYIDMNQSKTWVTSNETDNLPASWNWGDVNGRNYLTKNLNQHLPQWCGSCWAHGALSSLADRVKIARNTSHPDINLPAQFLLNCGNAGTCEGGDHHAAYKFIKDVGGIPFDTCLVYEACSYNSPQEVCKNRDFSCSPVNICRTSYSGDEPNVAITPYPNVTIKSFGALNDYKSMMAEIYKNGPIACALNAGPLMEYNGGVIDLPKESKETDHVVSIIGWGETSGKKYWIIRNSWGEFWGELGFFRIVLGENQLGIEGNCAFAIPDKWSEANKPCYLDGKNC